MPTYTSGEYYCPNLMTASQSLTNAQKSAQQLAGAIGSLLEKLKAGTYDASDMNYIQRNLDLCNKTFASVSGQYTQGTKQLVFFQRAAPPGKM
jgi:hypothetical protein